METQPPCRVGGRLLPVVPPPVEDLLWVEAPQLLWPDAVPQDAGEPEGHPNLDRSKDDVVSVSGGWEIS